MKKVVIVDDNAHIADKIRDTLDWNALGAQVKNTFYTPFGVIDAVRNGDADIIISDVKMPGMTGIELAQQVLQLQPEIKIILVSGYNDIEDVRDAIRLGAYDYLEKPVNIEYLTKILRKAIAQIDEERYIQRQLEERRSMLLDSFFERLIEYPVLPGSDLGKYPDYFGLDMDSRYHICICLRHLKLDMLHTQTDLEQYHRGFIQMENRLPELFSRCRLFHWVTKLDSMVIVLGGDAASEKAFASFCTDCMEKLFSYKDSADFIAGIGMPVDSLDGVHRSYEAAQNALEYRFFFSNERVFNYLDLSGNEELTDCFVEDQSEELIRYISRNEQRKIQNLTDSFYQSYARQQADKTTLFLAVYDTGMKVIRFMHKMGYRDEVTFRNLPRIDGCQTLEELTDWLKDLCLSSANVFNRSMQSCQQRLIQAVDDYIHSHYSDSELRMREIADHVGITSTYLSAMYKKAIGKNVTDVITQTRIEAAKYRLLYTKDPIKNISLETGFSNQYYFSSSFKKHTGYTPSEYRNAHQEQET